MRRELFDTRLQENNFRNLFIEMGWNHPKGQAELPVFIIDEQEVQIFCIAERNGFQVLQCEVPEIPTSSFCKKLDLKLRRNAYDYILIFFLPKTFHQLWVAPVKKIEKRDLVFIEFSSTNQADFLFSKIDQLSFNIAEQTTIVDVKQRVGGAFIVNSERLTKDFYAGFKKQHTSFVKFISGINDDLKDTENKNKQWYASVMLNRLMFCYFIQKKGFLDCNTNYLKDKLLWVQNEKGENRFFESFYKGFLSILFHDGLNSPRHDNHFEDIYGRIPYLNGGMFAEHELEQQYAAIDIEDEAFENLFDFFDEWHWHLDDRRTASGKDINPDVLGYIFEQYINDRAAMGAYYTKEDITEYISKNCILPFLIDKTRTATQTSEKDFKPEGFVWKMLRESGDRYIYDAVKQGYSPDWQKKIPDYISKGIDTEKPNLLERRSRWNEKTSEPFCLPTEIWRETIERLQRCDTLLNKIENGEIHEINDFITYNLDIRQFVYDLLANTNETTFVKHFYHALQNVTILDPTCGSGAFLFAAMNILEPLYEICIQRMEEWHHENNLLFDDELKELTTKYSSNLQYFIYKSIILRNLYGVDIMAEATEIAKLRLFLKMVAVVEVDKRKDNLGLDPLPDIDFNIKCGNTLVGYATEEEIDNSLIWGDMFAQVEFKAKIDEEMQKVADAFDSFRDEQLKAFDDNESIRETKLDLKRRLATLNDLLNQHMFKSITYSGNYDKWLKSHQPFHWLAEFYQIIKGNGGFDVIIGNPPYVVYTKKDKTTKKSISDIYKLHGITTESCNNLYAFVIERCTKIENANSIIGMIIPITGFANSTMSPLQNLLKNQGGYLHISTYHQRPAQLFVGVLQRLSIFISSQGKKEDSTIYTTGIYRWYADTRDYLLHNLSFVQDKQDQLGSIIKIGNATEISIKKKFYCHHDIIKYLGRSTNNAIYYRSAGGGYWITILNKPFDSQTTSNRVASFKSEFNSKVFSAFLNSSLFWWYYSTNFDLFNFTESWMFGSKMTYPKEKVVKQLITISDAMEQSLRDNAYHYVINSKTNGLQKTVTYRKYYSKDVMDEIDKVLAKHYGFTDEELDFIINYDIKYRMGDELNNEE